MEILEIFKEYSGKKLTGYPNINYSNLYKRVINNFHFEFFFDKGKYLFSPYYVLLRGEKFPELIDVITQNEDFFNSLKEFIINSLFVYSALIEENSYYLIKSENIIICRMMHRTEKKFELKFYSHYQDELLNSYNDKIYIGRDFIDLDRFERDHLGLEKYFQSLREQNKKIQERAQQKLRYYDEYKKPYLNEVEYLTKELASDSLERIKIFPEKKLSEISNPKLPELLDSIFYVLNLMIEMREFIREFENKLRQSKESDFVKYLTKFSKDLIDGIRYLRKISCQIHLRISNFSIA